jgi:hypothetical protein
MALDMAKTDPRVAKAMEASAQHFLVDRFAGGHLFNSDLVKEKGGGGLKGELIVNALHDQMNEKGEGARNNRGDRFQAYGDGHWADEDNKINREIASAAMASSYSELDTAITGKEHAISRYKPKNLVPRFSQNRQDDVEATASQMDWPDILVAQAHNLPNLAVKYNLRYVSPAELINDLRKMDEARRRAGGAKEGSAGGAKDGSAGAAKDGWDWTQKKPNGAGVAPGNGPGEALPPGQGFQRSIEKLHSFDFAKDDAKQSKPLAH